MLLAGVSPVIARLVGTKWVVAGGLSLFTVGLLVAAATFDADSGYTPVFFTMLAMGAGMGLAMAPATESVMGSLPKEKAGVGSAMSDTTRELGGTLGVAVGGSALAAIYASKLDTALSAAPLPPEAADSRPRLHRRRTRRRPRGRGVRRTAPGRRSRSVRARPARRRPDLGRGVPGRRRGRRRLPALPGDPARSGRGDPGRSTCPRPA